MDIEYEAIPFLLMLAIPVSALIRAIAAGCSERVRDSIAKHPIIHLIWFIVATVILVLPFFLPALRHTVNH